MNHKRDGTTKKVAIAIGALMAIIFGGVAFWAWQDNRIGKILFRVIWVILLPVNFILESILESRDAYFNIYVAVDVISMAVVGYLLGYWAYNAHRLRKRTRDEENRATRLDPPAGPI